MGYTTRQKSYIDQFRANWIAINRPSWTMLEREAYNKALANYIAGNPQIFDPAQIDTAREVQKTPIRELDTFSLGDAASIFFGEAINQAQRINPFSGMNQTKLWIVAGLAIVSVSAVIAYKITPKNITGK